MGLVVPLRLFFFFALTLALATKANALGIGELTLRSGLGEPLDAVINILDTPADRVDKSCAFLGRPASAAAGTSLGNAKITLTWSKTGHDLHLTTAVIMQNPVVNVEIGFHCSEFGTVRKSFVILLDPEYKPAQQVPVSAPAGEQKAARPVAHAVARQKKRHKKMPGDKKSPPLHLAIDSNMPAFPPR